MPPGADNHSYIEGVYSDVCDAYVRQPGAYVDEGEQRRLREVFSRFRAVKDVHKGDTAEHTAEVRFVTWSHSLDYDYVLPHVLSSVVAGRPVEILGLNNTQLKENHIYKWLLVDEYLSKTGLKDEDVVVVADLDVFFTGHDVLPVVEEFLATTPRSPAELDARKVRANQMRAPLLMSTEESCYMGQVIPHVNGCIAMESNMQVMFIHWMKEHEARCPGSTPWNFEKNLFLVRNSHTGPNSGSVVARVWALKEMIRSYRFFLAYRFPALDIFSNGDYLTWRSDQSVVGVMSWEMITWELSSGAVSPCEGEEAEAGWTPYNLRPGLVGFDYEQNFTITFIYGKRNYVNGEWFNESEMEKSVGRFYERLLNTYLEEPRKAQSMWALSPSPSGVPLAPWR
eukprot:gene7043-biopygen4319